MTTMASGPARRLSARRGSTSAPDPLGTRLSANPSLQSSSTLTIVRVGNTPTSPSHDPTAAPSSSPRRLHRRLPSQPQSGQENSNRLSFAFSSFASGPSPGGPANTSPSSSPRLRPSSPHGGSSPHRISTQLPPSNPRLAPDQLIELAKSSTNPRLLHQSTHYNRSPSNSPLLRAQSPSTNNPANITPATFTPLPDDILLPFIDRPSEVASLISSPPSAKLFSLLAQMFPQNASLDDKTDQTLPIDPTKWTYRQLHTHLTQATRRDCPDSTWVLQARKCIMSHSELIWERVKGALGVPPELDADYPHEFDFPSALSTSSIDTDELSDDHGRGPRGHWEDWDAVVDSPVSDLRHSFAHAPHDSGYFNDIGDASALSDVVSPTSVTIEPLLVPSATSLPQFFISSPPPNSMTAHGSLMTSEVVGLGLDDIQEGAEEEEQPADASLAAAPSSTGQDEQLDPDLILPSQIQGIRISTTPATASEISSPTTSPTLPGPAASSSSILSASGSSPYVAPSPVSPLPPYPPGIVDQARGTRSRPGSATFHRPHMNSSAYNYPSVFRRSGSFGSVTSSIHSDRGYESFSESGHPTIGDRPPGSPLFPSNFTKLNLEPTLGGHSSRPGFKRRAFSHGAAGVQTRDGRQGQGSGARPVSAVSQGA